MNQKTKNWIIVLVILIAGLAWYYWDQLKDLAAKISTGNSSVASASGSGSSAPAPVAPVVVAAAPEKRPYQFGSGEIYFNAFTPKELSKRSAFKSN